MESPKTLQDAIQFFAEYENCRKFMVAVRWPDGKVKCPYCRCEKVTYLANAQVYRCYGDHPKQKFSLKIGTVFEDSPIPLQKWLPAVWMLVNCRNGISSYEIHRALGVTQKTAWFMLHRIRLAMQAGSFMLGGPGNEVEADETFIGGKPKNMHKNRREALKRAQDSCLRGDTRLIGKSAVFGMLDRQQRKVRATVVPSVRRSVLQAEILKQVQEGADFYTDDAPAYLGLTPKYAHQVVNHLETYVKGRVHTNGIENFWALLKRGLNGTYVAVEPFHLFRYVDEQAFRYNTRKDEHGNKLHDGERFRAAMMQIVGKRLTFADLTGKTPDTTTQA